MWRGVLAGLVGLLVWAAPAAAADRPGANLPDWAFDKAMRPGLAVLNTRDVDSDFTQVSRNVPLTGGRYLIPIHLRQFATDTRCTAYGVVARGWWELHRRHAAMEGRSRGVCPSEWMVESRTQPRPD